MRQIYTKLLLAVVSVVCGVALANAEGPRFTTPADGDVIFLSEDAPLRSIMFECPWSDPSNGAVIRENGGSATLSKDGTVIQTLPISLAHRSTTPNKYYDVYWDFETPIFEPGTYTFTAPGNSFDYTTGTVSSTSTSTLDGFSFTFTVLDANSMKVTPANGSIVALGDIKEIVLEYSDKVKLQMQSADQLTMTQSQSNVVKDIFKYSASVRGQKITFTTDINSPITAPKKQSTANGNLTLVIPAGTFTVDGEPNLELTYGYQYSGLTATAITATPPPAKDVVYEVSDIRNIDLEYDFDLKSTYTNNNILVSLVQYIDGSYQRPNGFNSNVVYTYNTVDPTHATLTARPVEGTYTNVFDLLETGQYALKFAPNYLQDFNGQSNLEFIYGPY
ncbi:MAG: hypothetical protein K2J15_00350, partial [Muribaculaceae bacterium]|nr:hypothetical protein [Muribaculaceae bacterium]